MKKLNLLLMVILVASMYSLQGQERPFHVSFSVTDASCYNNGKIAYALTDPEGNVLEMLPEGLSQVRAYYKLSESDSAHYMGWYYMGGTDTMTVNSGNYIVGVEGLLEEGGGYVVVDTHLLMVVGTTYQKPDVAALYNIPRRYENAGLVPSVSCLNTGRVQLRILRGRFPYTVTVRDHVTGDTLRTTVFDDRQYSGTNPDFYDYKDYYTFDSMPAGNWDFYLEDGCGYGYPRVNQNVMAAQLPKMNDVYVYASTGDFNDSNIVRVILELDRDASLYEELMDQYVRYRFVYEGLAEGEWKKLPSYGFSMNVYDTVSEIGRYCDIMDKDITLEYKISLCVDTVLRKTFQYYRPNPIYFPKDTADLPDSIVYDANPCIRFAYQHRHYYSIRYYSDLYNDGIYVPKRVTAGQDHIYHRYHYTHPLVWEYTDARNGGVIKKDTVATIVDFSYLYDTDIEGIYGSLQDTTITIPVERKLLDAKGCELYTTLDTMTFYHRKVLASNCWKISHIGDDHCCEQMREVFVHTGYTPRVDPDGTIVRLVASPYNNRYNFEAVYHSDSRSWQIVKTSVENTSLVSGGVDGCSLALKDYCLPSGPYTFEIITPCDSFTVSDHIAFPYIYRTRLVEEPSYSVVRECANQYLKYTRGKLFKVLYNTSAETGLPLDEEVLEMTFLVEVVSGPAGGYSPNRYRAGDLIRISLPGTYVFRVFSNPFDDICEPLEYYDTVYFDETTVEFEYAYALLCDSSSTSGNAFVLGSNGVKPYTYTLFDHPDKQGEVLAVNNTGVFLDVPMQSDQEMSCLVEDSCHAYFHVNFYPRALADLQKIWFDGGLTVTNACEGSTIQVHALSIGDVLQYEWSGPDGFHSLTSDPQVFVPRGANDGWYKVAIHNNSCAETLYDSVFLMVNESPSVTMSPDTTVCPGQPVKLFFTPHSPFVDSVVNFTMAFSNKEGVELRHYSAVSGETVTDVYVTTTEAKVYPVMVDDGRCGYAGANPEDTLYLHVRSDVLYACSIQTRHDTVCFGGDALLKAHATLHPPYTLKWYDDYELTRWLKSDTMYDELDWSYYDTAEIVNRTLLYAAVEQEGKCPTVNGLYEDTLNMHDGLTHMVCGHGLKLYDSGGDMGDYSADEILVHRFVSSEGGPVTVSFDKMDLSTTAHLLVFSGGALNPDSLLYDFTAGVENPGLLFSYGDTLTLLFTGGSVSSSGWSGLVETFPGVAIAIPMQSNSVSLQDEVCQRESGYYEDPYGISPDVASYEELSEAVQQPGTYTFIQNLEGAGVRGCDSMVTFTLVVNPPSDEVWLYDTTIVSENPYTSKIDDHFVDLDVSSPHEADYHLVLQTDEGCDSIVVLHLTVMEKPCSDMIFDIVVYTCDYYYWDGEALTSPGVYEYSYFTEDGCDSLVRLHLEKGGPVYDTLYYVVMPERVIDNQVTVACMTFYDVFTPGLYMQTEYVNSTNGGCDSVITVYLFVESIQELDVCEAEYGDDGSWRSLTEHLEWEGQPFDYMMTGGSGYYEFPGELTLNGVTIDTITYLSLTVNPTGESADVLDLCLNGDSYTTDYNGQVSVTVNADGSVTASSLKPDEVEVITDVGEENTIVLRMKTQNGCDSIVTLTVNYEYVHHETLYKDTLYADEPYTMVFSNHEFTVNGPGVQTYTETLMGSNGCDSVITLQLIVNQRAEGDTTAVACESFSWRGETYTETGEYTQILTDVAGRDSVVTLHLTINHSTTGDTTAVACGSFPWHGETYTESGDYQFNTTNSLGCDSVVTLHLTLNHATTGDTTAFACGSFMWHGETYTESGDYQFNTTNALGCDSVVTLHLTLNHSTTGDTTAVACESFTWHGVEYTSTPTTAPTFTYETVNGCDSVVTLHLTINHSATGDTTAVACGSFTWHGETYTESGDYQFNTTNALGCDSVVTLHLTINHSATGDTTAVVCGSFSWHGETYTESGDYQFYTTNVLGCDSVVTLHLTVNHVTASDTAAVACESFTWHGETYTESGDYQFYTTNVLGCDSVVTLHLTLNNVTTGDTVAVACERFTWHGETYTESGDYQLYTTNASGCDSVVTLHLTVNHVTAGDTSAVACENFTWHGETYTESGDYQFYTTNVLDCDSVVTLHLTVNHVTAGDTAAIACESFTWHGETYTESGDYQFYTTNVLDCDSVVTLHLTINHLSLQVNSSSDEVCGDDGSLTVAATDGLEPIEYSLDGVNYQSSNVFNGLSDGSYTIHATDANGCEAATTVTIASAPVAELNIICPPTYYDTLAYGDCVMEIYPEAFGTPTATIYPAEWPFEISSEIPEENLYYEGTTTITYTMTDLVCGNTVTCDQHIVVVFPQCPDAIDCEGNVYHGVRIGCDCWTQTNLLSNCYGDPNECAESGECEDPIPCVYEYESDQFPNVDQNVDIYGRLYCAEAALDDSVINEHGHIRGICPEGWYLPTPEKYEELYQYGGGTSILTANGLRSPLYWLDGGGDDATGFRALPAGYYNGAAQQYERMLLDTYFWATEVIHGEVHSTAYKITYDCSEIQRTDIHSGYGISVRCVKEKD